MKKLFPLSLLFILILAVAFSGCSGGNGGGNNGENSGNPGLTYTFGQQSSPYTVDSVTFYMRYVPAVSRFPIDSNQKNGSYDDLGTGSVSAAYWIAETEMTYDLWNTVRTNLNTTYSFTNDGKQGFGSGSNGNHPVTEISWYDAIVWCNALTEYYNLKNYTNLGCVYKSGGVPIRNTNITSILDTVLPDVTAKGFRLPTSMEWELAARYRGNDSTNSVQVDGIYWTKGNSASGATADYNNTDATRVVAHNLTYTKEVAKLTLSNTLGLYDMSGNASEWCFNLTIDSKRVNRGGGFISTNYALQLGYEGYDPPSYVSIASGFRIVRSH